MHPSVRKRCRSVSLSCWLPVVLCTAALGLPAGACAQAAKAASPKGVPVNPQAAQQELDTLIKAAKAEGEVLFYSSPTENVAARHDDADVRRPARGVEVLLAVLHFHAVDLPLADDLVAGG